MNESVLLIAPLTWGCVPVQSTTMWPPLSWYGDEQPDRLAVVDAVVVDPVLEAPFARRAAFRARRASGARRSRWFPSCRRGSGPRRTCATSSANCCSAMWQAASCARRSPNTLHRQAHVLLDEGHQRLVALARLVELERRDAQAFGVDLGRIGRVRPGDAPADIGVMTDRAGEREPLARRDRAA